MTDNPDQELDQLLEDSTSPEWKRSAKAIELAFSWNQAAIQSIRNSRTDLIFALGDLTKALINSRESLADLNLLVDKFSPNAKLREALASEQAFVSKRSADVQTLQAEITRLEELKEENRVLITEQKKLQVRLQELSHLESFDPSSVEALRKQVKVVEQAKPWLSDLELLTKKLGEDLPILDQLTSNAHMLLKEKDQESLKKAQDSLSAIQNDAIQQSKALEDINKKYQAVQADIIERQKRFQDSENELRLRKEILDQFIRVDREIATAINNPEAKSAQQILDAIEAQLHSVDEALRLAIETNEKTRAIKKISV